jgi:hypothetical protein
MSVITSLILFLLLVIVILVVIYAFDLVLRRLTLPPDVMSLARIILALIALVLLIGATVDCFRQFLPTL